MILHKQLASDGYWLFRWRSYIPLVLAPLVVFTVWNFSLLGGSEALDHLLEAVCLSIMMLGFAIRAYAIGYSAPSTSGGNTKRQVAKDLNTTGLYSVVRHPLYLGNALIWMSIAIYGHNVFTIVVVALFFGLYYERIMVAEEEFLAQQFGERFSDWAAVTPAFIPSFRHWIPSSRKFDWRLVLRRDYGAVFAAVGIFTIIEVGGDWVVEGRLSIDPVWGALFFVTLAFYLAVLILKTRTQLLRSVRQN
jgi:protein-S-isoprenylcysteine O-methyltransferase Ste14